jgi:hypothetical protein
MDFLMRNPFKIYILDIKLVFCVCLYRHSIGSAPGRHTNLRPVSLESSGPEPAIFKRNFPEK